MAAKKKKLTFPEKLDRIIQIREERTKTYQEAHLKKGAVMLALFGGEIPYLETEEQINRYALLDFMVSKMVRYCANFDNGGHEDSLDDLAVYSFLLNELDGN